MSTCIRDTFSTFFKKATTSPPYPYQQKLARLSEIPDILNIPTGAGKTEAAILSIYIWRRFNADSNIRNNTPRRLVFCLPMRVLVEQTKNRIKEWLTNLGLEKEINLVTMMGGNKERFHTQNPEKNIIIVGTQDMLLSRALNRGYAISQYQWPIEFGLLNNDCLWIMDEIQLMQNGLITSMQLDSFRRNLGVFGPYKTVWMSATVNRKLFNTVDFDGKQCTEFSLSADDKKHKALVERNNAEKKLEKITIKSNSYAKEVTKKIKEKHIVGSLTLVIINTVKRAQEIFKELKKTESECMLIHSRFRAKEREALNNKLEKISSNEKNMIIISTQVVEAGIDVSARTMIVEISPWSSMIQRFGRCNRRGKHPDSKIFVIELDQKSYAPYQDTDMEDAKKELKNKYDTSVTPSSLKISEKEIIHESVIRKADIMALYDTTPDLSGNHTDVSMYIRSLEDSKDVAVAWREFTDGQPPDRKISHEEICNVPMGELAKFLKEKENVAWTYNIHEKIWERIRTQYPGQMLVVDCNLGGYSSEIGWDPKSTKVVDVMEAENTKEEGLDDDPKSTSSGWVTLNDHTVHVIREMQDIIQNTQYMREQEKTCLAVARYHDLGKAHRIFQETMKKDTGIDIGDQYWAKRSGSKNHTVPNYRHEAISAIALFDAKPNLPNLNLIAYLIAAHHGRVRLSMRTMPAKKTRNHDGRYILGISTTNEEHVPIFLTGKTTKYNQEDTIREDIPDEIVITTQITKIGSNENGRQSWLSRSLALLNEYGPFKMAMLEAAIRAADTRASAKEKEDGFGYSQKNLKNW